MSGHDRVDGDAHTLIAGDVDPDVPVSEPIPFLDRYRPGELLGEGGMGRVSLAHDARIGREVAMKVLHRDLQAKPSLRARFLREARIQGRLEHPSVVPIYDLGADDHDRTFFTMRRVQGETLASLLGNEDPGGRKLSQRKLLEAFGRVCLAVEFAHSRGVIHRDLKPDNVMLGDFGEVYVLDWGIARLAQQAPDSPTDPSLPSSPGTTQAGALLGTPGYMAPEQVAGETATTASDIYALGAILFEILTLAPAIDGDTLRERLKRTVEGTEARLDAVFAEVDPPPELARLCREAMDVNPGARPASARALFETVEGYLDGERDSELRRRLSEEHTIRAAAMLDEVEDLEQRRRVMQELGRALALAPDNAAAMNTMVQLMRSVPREAPPDVVEQTEASQRDRLRSIGRLAFIAYSAALLFLPVVWLVGVEDPWPFAGFFLGCLIAGMIARRVGTTGSQRGALWAMAFSCAGTAATAWIYGPLMVMPQTAVVNAMMYFFVVKRRFLRPALAGCLVFSLTPFALELAGVTQAYRGTQGGMLIVEQALTMNRTTMLIFGVATVVFGMLTGAVAASHYREQLTSTEQQLFMRDWHLRQLVGVPSEAA